MQSCPGGRSAPVFLDREPEFEFKKVRSSKELAIATRGHIGFTGGL